MTRASSVAAMRDAFGEDGPVRADRARRTRILPRWRSAVVARTIRVALAALFLAPPLMILGWAGLLRLTGNVHEFAPGLYRSGQLSAGQLSSFMATHGIATVINLRGTLPGRPWYDAEAEAVRRAGAAYLSVPLSANHEPDPATLALLMRDLEGAKAPLLIHCDAGADRSGLAAVLYERFVLHRPAEIAVEQLSFRYGHFPWLMSRSGAMDRTFARFVRAGSTD